jgi:hypothetical protein
MDSNKEYGTTLHLLGCTYKNAYYVVIDTTARFRTATITAPLQANTLSIFDLLTYMQIDIFKLIYPIRTERALVCHVMNSLVL